MGNGNFGSLPRLRIGNELDFGLNRSMLRGIKKPSPVLSADYEESDMYKAGSDLPHVPSYLESQYNNDDDYIDYDSSKLKSTPLP